MHALSERVTAIETEIGDSAYTGDSITAAINVLQTEIGDSAYTGDSITAAINELQTKLSSSTWASPNLINGVIDYNGESKYRKIGDIVTIDLHLKVPAENTSVIAFKLSTAFRPTKEMNFMVTSGGTAGLVTYVKIEANGDVTVSVSGSGNQYAIGTITFIK